MAKPKTTALHRVADRPGEGVPVEYTRQHSVGVDGATGVAISVDLSNAPVPERRYVADIASVVRVDDSVQLIFGQSKVTNRELRSLVVIQVPGRAVLQFLDSAPGILDTMNAFVKVANVREARLTDISQEPSQTVALAASIIMAAVSGRDACLDFYYSSPYVALQVTKGGAFAVDPVARVMLPMNLLLALCNKLDAIKSDLPKDSVEVRS